MKPYSLQNFQLQEWHCRQSIHSYVSTRLHKTVKEGFTVKEDTKYGIEGITLKEFKT